MRGHFGVEPDRGCGVRRAREQTRLQMHTILLVRMSSLGDIVHTFPVLTDIRRERPQSKIHWAVEEAYVSLAALHPAVDRIIPIALRPWRRQLFARATWRALGDSRRQLGETDYDLILDTQGLIKSLAVAQVARRATRRRGHPCTLHGFGRGTISERLAAHGYDVRHEFQPQDHKIYRYRTVAAQALGYAVPAAIDYGLTPPPRPAFAPSGDYAVLLHATARAAKLWSEAAWIQVAQALAVKRVVCVLPWGDGAEQARARRIAAAAPPAAVAPSMSIPQAAALLAHARVVVGVDTGLMHLAAAFAVPTVGVFCDSEPLDAKPVGAGPTTYRGGIGAAPAASAVLTAIGEVVPALA
jgi:heptosyltransferase-1